MAARTFFEALKSCRLCCTHSFLLSARGPEKCGGANVCYEVILLAELSRRELSTMFVSNTSAQKSLVTSLGILRLCPSVTHLPNICLCRTRLQTPLALPQISPFHPSSHASQASFSVVTPLSVLLISCSSRTLRDYDFRAARAVLVPSVPGTGKTQHAGPSLHKYGHMRVRAKLRNERVRLERGGHKVVMQISSLASLTDTPVRLAPRASVIRKEMW